MGMRRASAGAAVRWCYDPGHALVDGLGQVSAAGAELWVPLRPWRICDAAGALFACLALGASVGIRVKVFLFFFGLPLAGRSPGAGRRGPRAGARRGPRAWSGSRERSETASR